MPSILIYKHYDIMYLLNIRLFDFIMHLFADLLVLLIYIRPKVTHCSM